MPPIHSAFQNPKSPIRSVAIKEHLVGGKIGEIRGEAPSATTVSYFKGNDPSQWKANLATAELVNLGEVYEGIDLMLKAYGNNVEKLFTVKPGANPKEIKIRLSGVKECGMRSAECGIENPNSQIPNPKLQINPAGELVAETELGAVKFTKPVAYQEIDGKRVEVACEYAIAEGGTKLEFGFWNLDWFPYSEINNFRFPKSALQNPNSKFRNQQLPTQPTYSFKVASYDTTKDLIIDPLLASTFLGGESGDYASGVAMDKSGNVYVTGVTYSGGFPTTGSVYDNSYNGGNEDVFVSKFNSDLSQLLAATYLGSSSDYDSVGADYSTSIAIDKDGNIFVAGYTYSRSFPTTPGAYDESYVMVLKK